MQKITNEIRLIIPDEHWFDAPAPLTWRYYPVFTEVARALHQAVRDELPKLFFSDPARLAILRYTFPLLVLQGSRPSTSREDMFCHDVLNPAAMDKFFRMARRKLAGSLADARDSAKAAGMEEVAKLFDPRHSDVVLDLTRRQVGYRRPLNTMLAIEARLLHELLIFNGRGRHEPRARRIADFNKNWNILLRRFCGKFDFTEAGPALMKAATAALIEAQRKLDAELDSQAPYDWAA